MRILSGSTRIAFGFGLGVMAAGLVKGLRPAFRGLGRPLLKATVKSGILLARDGRTKIAQFRETLADVTAEAEAELARAPEMPPQQPFAEQPKQSAGVM